ncbi:Guanosine-5'-triphosphate,3'-diphosphate pyrophosphatase, partial [Thalictrum thalictroides]
MATDISNPSNLLAAVDMGTNSFKMLVVRAEPNGRFLTVDRLKEPVVLGRGMNSNVPTINLEAQHRAISALHKFKNFLHNQQVEHTKFVATSAVREAVNKGEFLSTIEEETCCKVEILSGEEEARLVYIGVLQFLPIYDKTVLTIDIGGGSTEFVVGKQGKVIFAISLKLGHVSLTEAFAKNGEIGNMREYIRSVIYESGLVEKIRDVGFEIAVGSSGTIRSIEKAVYMGYAQDLMSAVVSYGVFKRNWKFSRKDLSCVVEKLCDKDQKEYEDVRRNRFFKRRSEFILAGAVLLSEIFEILNIDEMEVSEYALGEGVIAETIAQCCSVFDVNANARWRSVIRLSSRFNSDKRIKSATRCAGIAREFFAGLRKYDELGDHRNGCMLELDWKDLEYLEAACLLHNIGLYIGKKGHHKQSYHIIKNGDYLQGYSAEEVELIALLARYHRKRFPKSDDSSFHLFPDKVKKKFRILCAIVRISVAVQQCLFTTFQRLEISSCPERLEL